MAYNPYIVVPLATWAVAQLAKFALAALRGRIDFRYLYSSGGMPSVHSAVVCSLAVTAWLIDGVDSPIFGFAAVFAAIVMYDSFGVRRSAGEQAAAINMLVASLDKGKVRLEQPSLHLREILGHQPSEVTAGAIVGVVLGGLFNYERLGSLFSFLQVTPLGWELWLYVGIFAVLVIGGVIQRFVLVGRYPKSATIRHLTRRILTITQTIGWLGLAAVLLQYERASYMAWRFWALAVILTGLMWGGALFFKSYRTVPKALSQELNTARKQKWFTSGRKGKAKRA